MPLILDGIIVREAHLSALREKISRLSIKPKLQIFAVGDDPRSNIYIEEKRKRGEKVGITVLVERMPSISSTADVVMRIEQANNDESVHGIIVQLPLPQTIHKDEVIQAIAPTKDVDGLTMENVTKLSRGDTSGLVPATAKGILSLLDFYKVRIAGKKVAVLGRSLLVGSPTAKLLELKGGVVTVCNSKTENIQEITKKADIIVVAIGKLQLINKEYVGENKPVVVDVGINPILGEVSLEEGGRKVAGDVKFNEVASLSSAITPVPGGVGPMTVTSLLENVFFAACDTLAKRTSKK